MLPLFLLKVHRLIRCCLGATAIAEKKLEAGNPLTVLGVNIEIDMEGVIFWPAEDKIDKWKAKLESTLARGTMTQQDACKLSGSLQWGTQYIFRRLGRAMLRPLYR